MTSKLPAMRGGAETLRASPVWPIWSMITIWYGDLFIYLFLGFFCFIIKSFQDYGAAPADIQKSIDTVVSCVKQLTDGEDGERDPECIRDRDAKQESGLFSDTNEAVSFILSIEPVHENVQEILNETQDLVTDPRNPKAIFVMLPNFDELSEGEVSEVRSEEQREARLTLDTEFLIEEDSQKSGDEAEEADTGSGSARAQHP